MKIHGLTLNRCGRHHLHYDGMKRTMPAEAHEPLAEPRTYIISSCRTRLWKQWPPSTEIRSRVGVWIACGPWLIYFPLAGVHRTRRKCRVNNELALFLKFCDIYYLSPALPSTSWGDYGNEHNHIWSVLVGPPKLLTAKWTISWLLWPLITIMH